MKKILDLVVVSNEALNQNYCLLKLTTLDNSPLPEMKPGQFVEIRVDGASKVFLRRPISINFVDLSSNQLWLLVQIIGNGTQRMSEMVAGTRINLLLPLGNSFSIPEDNTIQELLLVGGGVGIAPMLYLGQQLASKGYKPNFLLGARSHKDLLQLADFEQYGNVYCTTEDGSYGEKGFVTNHSIWDQINISKIYTCGPKPMMQAIAKLAHTKDIDCEVSLENTMACGFGVCLCCVEDIKERGNVCVCTEGPVFNTKELKWID